MTLFENSSAKQNFLRSCFGQSASDEKRGKLGKKKTFKLRPIKRLFGQKDKRMKQVWRNYRVKLSQAEAVSGESV